MLITRFRQSIPPQVDIDKPLLEKKIPAEAADEARKWMVDCKPQQLSNCDVNARVCWATLQGGKDRQWIETAWKEGTFKVATLSEWTEEIRKWAQNPALTLMMVRFIDQHDSNDGHTVLLYKHGNVVWTFQAYYDVCPLTSKQGDIFADGV
jgi:hypothetical protein